MANPVYHVTFTKDVADIQKRGLDPLSQSLWEKAETGERYQQDPFVYGFSDPKEALNWATKMAWEFEASPSDISILTLEGGDHWQKDPSGDLNLGQSAQQSLRLVEPSEVLDVFSLPEPVGTNAEFQEAVPGGDFEDWKDFYSKRLGSRPPDQSNLPAAIGAAAEASRLALPPDDETRPTGKVGPKKKPFGSGVGSLMRRRMFPLIEAVQQGYEHLLTEEQKNDLREFLAQPTHEFFGFKESGLESLKKELGISPDDMPGLPMDLNSRLSRMHEMGFNLDAYHGTTEGDPAAWDPENTVRESFPGSDRGYSSWPADIGDWFTEDPYVASSGFAEGEGGHVIPVKLRLKNPAVYPTYEDLESALAKFPDTEEFREHLQKKGHDGILIEDSFTDVPVSREDYVVFDNKNIRSRFARFDPADSESGDMSKAHGGFVDG